MLVRHCSVAVVAVAIRSAVTEAQDETTRNSLKTLRVASIVSVAPESCLNVELGVEQAQSAGHMAGGGEMGLGAGDPCPQQPL
jgi:hypothetical protein